MCGSRCWFVLCHLLKIAGVGDEVNGAGRREGRILVSEINGSYRSALGPRFLGGGPRAAGNRRAPGAAQHASRARAALTKV